MKRIIISLLVAVVTGIAVTDLLQNQIYFSLMVGIPAGIVAGIATFAAYHMVRQN